MESDKEKLSRSDLVSESTRVLVRWSGGLVRYRVLVRNNKHWYGKAQGFWYGIEHY